MVLRWYFDGSSKEFRGFPLFASPPCCPPTLHFCLLPSAFLQPALLAGPPPRSFTPFAPLM